MVNVPVRSGPERVAVDVIFVCSVFDRFTIAPDAKLVSVIMYCTDVLACPASGSIVLPQ